MTFAELRRGARHRDWGEKRTANLLRFVAAHFAIVHSDNEMAEEWARLRDAARRAGRKIRTADCWIAATATSHGVPLITNNAKDFDYLPGLTLITNP